MASCPFLVRLHAFFIALPCAGLALPAIAQDYGDPGGKTIAAVADFRLTAGDGERAWTDGGFGKTRYGADGSDDFHVRSAFLLATRNFGTTTLSARAEAFGTHGRGSVTGADDSEDGWAGTIAIRRDLGEHATPLAEALHVDSDRAARTRDGLDSAQRQTLLQMALRLRL